MCDYKRRHVSVKMSGQCNLGVVLVQKDTVTTNLMHHVILTKSQGQYKKASVV